MLLLLCVHRKKHDIGFSTTHGFRHPLGFFFFNISTVDKRVRTKSLQLWPTLCDPMDCSPPGSSVHGILQARVLQWVDFSPPGDLADPGIKPASLMSNLHWQMGSLPLELSVTFVKFMFWFQKLQTSNGGLKPERLGTNIFWIWCHR